MRPSTLRWIVFSFFLKSAASQNDEISRWAYGLRGSLLKGCPTSTPTLANPDNPDFLGALRHCLQHRAILAVDTLLMYDVIPILDGINLVRYRENRSDDITDNEFDSDWRRNDVGDKEIPSVNDGGWQGVVGTRLIRLFRTHVLKIDLDQVSKSTGFYLSDTFDDIGENVAQGRRRRHKRKGILPIVMMGFLFMGTILIPMGFQFLAVLGGKALILAKMALMLSSIQGLKKIATSGVNYGLYHSPVSDGWHERSNHRENTLPIEIPRQSYPQEYPSP